MGERRIPPDAAPPLELDRAALALTALAEGAAGVRAVVRLVHRAYLEAELARRAEEDAIEAAVGRTHAGAVDHILGRD